MPRGGANFTGDELALVLSHYDIGVIGEVTGLRIGNSRAPKSVINAERGKFLLKRRPTGRDDAYHVGFAHSIMINLQEKGFPVAHIERTRDGETAVMLNGHIYELFGYVHGSRYETQREQTVDAGRKLAEFHRLLEGFKFEWNPVSRTFHDSPEVRRFLKIINSEKRARIRPGKEMKYVTNELMVIYNKAAVNVNQSGYETMERKIIHGDWHPGNMLFDEDKVVAVVDFDSVRKAPRIIDIANGILQFSIIAGAPSPDQWPENADEQRIGDFFRGYAETGSITAEAGEILPDLMMETMISEAVRPIAATGTFANLKGLDFLKMIYRKCGWIDQNRKLLAGIISKHSS